MSTSITSSRPLAGVRVIDLSALTPGPFATLMLAELGATVIKIERPGQGDPLRAMLPKSFELLNRGKLSVALDLKLDTDREQLLALCDEADVLVEGFRPGVMDRLGLGFDAVHERCPTLTYLSLSSYGQRGSLSTAPGHDLNFVGLAGGLDLDDATGDHLCYGTYQLADLAASAYTVIAILAALRLPGGPPAQLDLSLLGSALAFTQLAAAEAEDRGDEATAGSQRAANGIFVTGDRGRITICAVEDHFWQALCTALELPALGARPEFMTYAGRLAHGDEVNGAVARRVLEQPADHWLAVLTNAGVPVARVLTPEQVRTDRAVGEGGWVDPSQPGVRFPVLGIAGDRLSSAPALGADTDRVRSHGWSRGSRDDEEVGTHGR